MGNGSSGIFINGDWEHKLCWMDYTPRINSSTRETSRNYRVGSGEKRAVSSLTHASDAVTQSAVSLNASKLKLIGEDEIELNEMHVNPTFKN